MLMQGPADAQATLVLLPGRGGSAQEMLFVYGRPCPLEKVRLVALQPYTEWYPAPNGACDQSAATEGLKLSVPNLDAYLSDLEEELEQERSTFALVGFSAGGVMAIQTAAHAERPFGAVVVHSGAVLVPDDLPPAKHTTPILLTHSRDDDCFKWKERFLPMKKGLEEKGYPLVTVEHKRGGHMLRRRDVEAAAAFLSLHLPAQLAAMPPHV
jgi:predicted esterase